MYANDDDNEIGWHVFFGVLPVGACRDCRPTSNLLLLVADRDGCAPKSSIWAKMASKSKDIACNAPYLLFGGIVRTQEVTNLTFPRGTVDGQTNVVASILVRLEDLWLHFETW